MIKKKGFPIYSPYFGSYILAMLPETNTVIPSHCADRPMLTSLEHKYFKDTPRPYIQIADEKGKTKTGTTLFIKIVQFTMMRNFILTINIHVKL